MKGFIFSSQSAYLIAAGRKTQTRRVVKPQPEGADKVFFYPGTTTRNPGHFSFLKSSDRNFVAEGDRISNVRPRLEGEEVFYVKEMLYRSKLWFPGAAPDPNPELGEFVGYAAEMSEAERWLASIKPGVRQVNARNVGEDAARIFLRCTEARVERLQEITHGDANREIGTEMVQPYSVWSFRDLWNHVNPQHSWELNPWVFVYSFAIERLKSTGPAKEIQAKGLDFLPESTGL